jgi:hypothetical protein
MKKTMYFVIAALLIMSISAVTAANADAKKAETTTIAVTSSDVLSAEEMNVLTLRVEEIRDMDKSNMTALEKRELRNELKLIKKDMRGNGAIYIGTGTLLLIIILIILLV